MLLHTPEQLQGLQEFAGLRASGAASFDIAGIAGEYQVADFRTQRPFDLAVAAAFVPEQGEIIIVDETVPPLLRGLWAWHEKADSLHPDHGTLTSACRKSESTLLAFLREHDPSLGREYIGTRIEFYDNLVKWLIGQTPIGEGSGANRRNVSGARAARIVLTSSLHRF